jgi:hypothetical protein
MKQKSEDSLEILADGLDVSLPIKLGKRVYSEDLSSQLHFDSDPGGLNKALVEQSSRFAHWAALECIAKETLEKEKNGLALLEAELFRKIEEILTEKEEKKPTLDRIRSEMIRRPEHKEQKELVQNAQAMLDRIVVGRQALYMRKDCLIEVARNLRAEMEGPLSVTSRQAGKVENAKSRAKKLYRGDD